MANQFGQANRDFVALIESIPDDQWNTLLHDEQRTIGVVAHHVATNYILTFGVAQLLGSGDTPPEISWEWINANNAQHAEQNADATKAETLSLLQTNAEQVETGLRSMTDDQLALVINVPIFGGEMTVEQLINGVVIGHIGMHAPGIASALN